MADAIPTPSPAARQAFEAAVRDLELAAEAERRFITAALAEESLALASLSAAPGAC